MLLCCQHRTFFFPKPTLDAIRLTAKGKAKDVNNKKLDSAHYLAALKTATKMYYEELQKPKGEIRLSAEEVEKIIKARFDEIGPSARTITRYVNDYSLVGSSPVKHGSPGTLPDWAFESLCVALESYISINQVNQNCTNNRKKIWRRE